MSTNRATEVCDRVILGIVHFVRLIVWFVILLWTLVGVTSKFKKDPNPPDLDKVAIASLVILAATEPTKKKLEKKFSKGD